MIDWNMSDEDCAEAASVGAAAALLWPPRDDRPLHVVRECMLAGFDRKAAELLGEDKPNA